MEKLEEVGGETYRYNSSAKWNAMLTKWVNFLSVTLKAEIVAYEGDFTWLVS